MTAEAPTSTSHGTAMDGLGSAPDVGAAPLRTRSPWLREVVIVHAFYWAYQAVRKAAGSRLSSGAYANARRIERWERALFIYNEQAIQAFFLGATSFIKLMNIYYGTLHFIITSGLLVWMFLRRPAGYRRIRNILGTTTGLALIGYWSFPLAPPRLYDRCVEILPQFPRPEGSEGCFVDTLADVGGLWSYESPVAKGIANNFAAMPSLHFGWSLWCAMVFYRHVGGRFGRTMAYVYPSLTAFAIVVTGNHYWLDAAGGAVVLLMALGVLRLWRRIRPPAEPTVAQMDDAPVAAS
jgi:hypothetical protein